MTTTKRRYAVYVKYQGKWHCVALHKDRAMALDAYHDLGERKKKMEFLEVTNVYRVLEL
jgi:hypothetical protein